MEHYTDKSLANVIKTMVTTIEARDVYTHNHSSRVADMSYKLGVILGMDEKELELIHIAGDLHDLGKIGIPDRILNKPDKLEVDELEVMRQHSYIGYDILNKLNSFDEISTIVLYHHERWDGGGYPSGLKSEEIPFESRVLAVCDSIDAMKSDRPYRKSLSDRICRDEISKNKGIMYDSYIAECMIDNWEVILNGIYD